MGNEKLSPDERRELTLRMLRGESPTLLSKEYNIARSWVYALVDETLENPQAKLREAKEEYEFRHEVLWSHVQSKARELGER